MNDEQYLRHCREFLADFARELRRHTDHLPAEDPLRELAREFSGLEDDPGGVYTLGPALATRLFTTYPELAPMLPRQLLWFFGGDCLHYMPEEEIARFQQLDEMRREAADRGETLDLRAARASLLNVH